jgi:hypothetical protein
LTLQVVGDITMDYIFAAPCMDGTKKLGFIIGIPIFSERMPGERKYRDFYRFVLP